MLNYSRSQHLRLLQARIKKVRGLGQFWLLPMLQAEGPRVEAMTEAEWESERAALRLSLRTEAK